MPYLFNVNTIHITNMKEQTKMGSVATWPTQAQSWLDNKGKGAWIAAMVLGFVLFWPIGLALLFYMIWSNRMSCSHRGNHRGHSCRHKGRSSFRSSGNTAFDAYKDETLKRLEDEQEAFQSFLEQLRAAKDKTEFDAFMDDRAKAAKPVDEAADDKGKGDLVDA